MGEYQFDHYTAASSTIYAYISCDMYLPRSEAEAATVSQEATLCKQTH
jgi:hypothetical protein